MVYVVFYASMEIMFTTLRELNTFISRLPIGVEITVNVRRA